MTLTTSTISFGAYTFPFGAWIKQLQGSTDIDQSPMLGLDGVIAPAGVLKAQTVTVEMIMGGDGSFDPKSTSMSIDYLITPQDLNSMANDLFAQLEEGYQGLAVGYTPARSINAQKSKFEIGYTEGAGRRNATISIDFLAPDPRWLTTATNTITASGSASNGGNMITYPIVTYTQTGGAAGSPVSLKVANTSGYIELDLLLTLQSGDTLVINCDPRQRSQGIVYTPSGGGAQNGLVYLGTSGITNTYGNDATFPYMLPGANTVTMAGANSIAYTWADAYAL